MLPEPLTLQRLLAAQGAGPEDDAMVQAVRASLAAVPGEARRGMRAWPCPLPPCDPYPEGRLSPRALAILARALGMAGGDHVLLVGAPLVALVAAWAELPEAQRPDHVVLLATEPGRARWTARRARVDERIPLAIHAADDAGLAAARTAGPYTRALTYAAGPLGRRAGRLLAPDSTALAVIAEPRRVRVVQHVRSDEQGVDIDLSGQPVPVGEPTQVRVKAARTPEAPFTLARLFLVEAMQANVWRGVATSPAEVGIRDAVRAMFPSGAEDATRDNADAHVARRLFHLGYLEQAAGTRVGAEALYRASLDVSETAEAWTFLGWAVSRLGDTQTAIDACHRAIETDPDLGNPYNDIGAYLLAEGRPDDAKTWFRRATAARRYASPHFPYTNLGRVYLREGDLGRAREAIENALERMPDYGPALRLLKEIEAREKNDVRKS